MVAFDKEDFEILTARRPDCTISEIAFQFSQCLLPCNDLEKLASDARRVTLTECERTRIVDLLRESTCDANAKYKSRALIFSLVAMNHKDLRWDDLSNLMAAALQAGINEADIENALNK